MAVISAFAPLQEYGTSQLLTLLQNSPAERFYLVTKIPISFILLHSSIWLVKTESNICNMQEVRKEKLKKKSDKGKERIPKMEQNLLKAF